MTRIATVALLGSICLNVLLLTRTVPQEECHSARASGELQPRAGAAAGGAVAWAAACERAARSPPASTDRAVALTDCIVEASLARNGSAAALTARWFNSSSTSALWEALPRRHRVRLPTFLRWHLETQDRLFGHLRDLWRDDVPRVMVDLGCHAGHSRYHNSSDALLWLDRFHHRGGAVLGVDAFEPYAQDLQLRFDHVEPYRSLQGVSKRALTLAIDQQESKVGVDLSRLASSSLFKECVAGFGVTWGEVEAEGHADHYCRIPRQLLGLGDAATLRARSSLAAAPPPVLLPAVDAAQRRLLGKYVVPTARADGRLWQQELDGRHISLLKVDIDRSWRDTGLERLLEQRAVSVIVIEVDTSWPLLAEYGVSHFDQLCWLAHRRHGFTPYFKVPCTARRKLPPGLEPGLSTSYVRLLNDEGHFVPTGHHLPKGKVGEFGLANGFGIQDLMLVDERRHPELRELQRLGDADCKPLPLLRPVSSAELASVPLRAAEAWLAAAPRGFCGSTDATRPGDCDHDGSGVLGLLPQELSSRADAARACLARCHGCSRCNFVSLSLTLGDCSWYARCDLSRLDDRVNGVDRDARDFVSGDRLLK